MSFPVIPLHLHGFNLRMSETLLFCASLVLKDYYCTSFIREWTRRLLFNPLQSPLGHCFILKVATVQEATPLLLTLLGTGVSPSTRQRRQWQTGSGIYLKLQREAYHLIRCLMVTPSIALLFPVRGR